MVTCVKSAINATGAQKRGLEIGYFYVYFNGRIIQYCAPINLLETAPLTTFIFTNKVVTIRTIHRRPLAISRLRHSHAAIKHIGRWVTVFPISIGIECVIHPEIGVEILASVQTDVVVFGGVEIDVIFQELMLSDGDTGGQVRIYIE